MKENQKIKNIHTIVVLKKTPPPPPCLAIISTLCNSGLLKNEDDVSKLSQTRSVQS